MKRIAWGIAIVLGLLLVANALMAWRVDGQLAAKKAAIRNAGDPASIADMRPTPIPDADNAAAQIAGLAPLLDAFGKDHAQFLDKTELGKAWDEEEDRREPPTAEQAEAIRAILEKHAALAAGLERAAALDAWASRADFSVDHTKFIEKLLGPIQKIRSGGRMIDWQMKLSIYDGKLDQGMAQGISLLRLARMNENEPTLVSYLVTIAMRGVAMRGLYDVLAAGPVSPEMHAALDAELARADNPQSFINVLKTERAAAFDAMDPVSRGTSPVMSRTLGWVVKRYYVQSLDFLDDLNAEAGKPWTEFRKAFKSGGSLTPLSKYGVLGELLWPAVVATVKARERDLTQIRALRVFNALRAFAEENGREAMGMAELDAAIIAAAVDPATAAPLMLKHTDAGWTVYGAGENGRDDGGAVEKQMDDYGLGPAEANREPAGDDAGD